MVLGGCRWFFVVLGGFRSFHVLVTTLPYVGEVPKTLSNFIERH